MKAVILKNIIALLVAAGLTVGIPALRPANRSKKAYYLSWVIAAAGVFLVFLGIDIARDYASGLVQFLFVLLFLVAYLSLGTLAKSLDMSDPKVRQSMKGVTAGLFSGIVLIAGWQYAVEPILGLFTGNSTGDEIIPAIILVIVFVGFNLFWQKDFF